MTVSLTSFSDLAFPIDVGGSLTVSVDSGVTTHNVAEGYYTAEELSAAINEAAGAEVTSYDGAGGILVTNTSETETIVFGGLDAFMFGDVYDMDTSLATVPAQTPGAVSTSGLATALEEPVPASSLTLNEANALTIQLGDNAAVTVASGSYASQDALLAAVNTALGGNATASLDNNVLIITSSEGITLGDTAGLFAASSYEVEGSLESVSVLDVEAANDAMHRLDAALTRVSDLRSTFGAIQNRFESTIANLSTTVENLSASRSRVMDTDFASETANLTRAQILQQAGIAMLTQANQMPQSVLSLLR